jgi:hypothetical protein
MDHAGRLLLGAHRHPAHGTQREERNGMALFQFVQMVAVRRNAVTTVTIPVESDAGEGDVELLNDPGRSLQDGRRRRRRGWVQAVVGYQTWYVDFAVVHLPSL